MKLPFSLTLGINYIPQHSKVTERVAMRAVLWYKGHLVMIKTAKGDYKFPGGGVNSGEDKQSALLREIREETGYCNITVGELVGTAVQQNQDFHQANGYFKMVSYYYWCTLTDCSNIGQELDDYEKNLHFQSEFITPQQAFLANQVLLQHSAADSNLWLERETKVLQILAAT